MNTNVNVRYFALLRDVAGKSTEDVAIETGSSAAKLFHILAEKYAFPLSLADLRVAVNDEFTGSDHPLKNGDRVVFIPPVSGG